MKNKNQILITVIITIFVSALLGGGVWYFGEKDRSELKKEINEIRTSQKMVDSRADEKVLKSLKYENNELGIGFDYPEYWGEVRVKDGVFESPGKGKYKKIVFSKVTSVGLNIVLSPYSTPMDGCGYSGLVIEGQKALDTMIQGSLVGHEANSIKQYNLVPYEGYKPEIKKRSLTIDGGLNKVGLENDILTFSVITKNEVDTFSESRPCSAEVHQGAVDEANDFKNIYYYATNKYSSNKFHGINSFYDFRMSGIDVSLEKEIKGVFGKIVVK